MFSLVEAQMDDPHATGVCHWSPQVRRCLACGLGAERGGAFLNETAAPKRRSLAVFVFPFANISHLASRVDNDTSMARLRASELFKLDRLYFRAIRLHYSGPNTV